MKNLPKHAVIYGEHEAYISTCILQIGKTKVFLRAGQMAELDARRAEVLSNAAKTIQRRTRTHIARKQFIALRKATIYVQSRWRGKAFEATCWYMSSTTINNAIYFYEGRPTKLRNF